MQVLTWQIFKFSSDAALCLFLLQSNKQGTFKKNLQLQNILPFLILHKFIANNDSIRRYAFVFNFIIEKKKNQFNLYKKI